MSSTEGENRSPGPLCLGSSVAWQASECSYCWDTELEVVPYGFKIYSGRGGVGAWRFLELIGKRQIAEPARGAFALSSRYTLWCGGFRNNSYMINVHCPNLCAGFDENLPKATIQDPTHFRNAYETPGTVKTNPPLRSRCGQCAD